MECVASQRLDRQARPPQRAQLSPSRKASQRVTDTDGDRSLVADLVDQLRAQLGRAKKRSSINRLKQQLEWLEPARFAKIYAYQGNSDHDDVDRESADVFHMTMSEFMLKSDRGDLFDKPLVLKQPLAPFQFDDFKRNLELTHGEDIIDVRQPGKDHPKRMTVPKFLELIDDPDKEYNALNLRGGLCRADEPAFTRMPRWSLLRHILESSGSPGKEDVAESNDITGCLSFAILGGKMAYSNAHVDLLSGTCLRVLCGTKLWLLLEKPTEQDRRELAAEGLSWSPKGRGRILVLKEGDILLMPPGAFVIHGAFTASRCLIQGLMLWDYKNVTKTVNNLSFIAKHPKTTNEPFVSHILNTIDVLEARARAKPDVFGLSDKGDLDAFLHSVAEFRGSGAWPQKALDRA